MAYSNRRFFAASIVVLAAVSLLAGCNLGAQQNNVAGQQAFQSGNTIQAINRFQRAISQNPRNADAYYNLAATFYAMGRGPNGQTAVANRNNNGAGQYLSQAEELYRQAISLNGNHPQAHRGLAGLLIETGRESYAFDLINGWKDRSPRSAEPLIELARLYQEYGDKQHAKDLLADAIRVDSGNVRAYTAMGILREGDGQDLLALDNYMRALQIGGAQPEIAGRVAQLQQRVANANGMQTNPGVGTRYGAAQPWQRR